MARLMRQYYDEIQATLGQELGIGNKLAVPRLTKVVVSMGLGKALQEKKLLAAAVKDLSLITGQKPVVCKAKKSVSNFKLRKGYEIGAKVTLRGRRMYEFIERLFNTAIPRTRDFRGLNPASFDGHGNYSMGVVEQTIFPEINIDKAEFFEGMNITFVTTAERDSDARQLLTLMGMPFRAAEDSEEAKRN